MRYWTLDQRVSSGDIEILSEERGQIAIGDLNGDVLADMHLSSMESGQDAVTKGWESAGPQVSSNFYDSSLFDDFDVEVEDVNGDGRLDLAVIDNGRIVQVLLSGPGGVFKLEFGDKTNQQRKNEIDQSTRLIWRYFADVLSNGNMALVQEYATSHLNEKLTQLNQVLGAEVSEVVNQVVDIAPCYMSEEIAIYLVRKEEDNGNEYLHTMMFVQINGGWFI